MKITRKKYKGAKFITAKELIDIVDSAQTRAEMAIIAGLFVGYHCEQYDYPVPYDLTKEEMEEYIEGLLSTVDETMDVLDGKLKDLRFYYERMCNDYFTPPDEFEEKMMYESGALSSLYLYSDEEKEAADQRAKMYEGKMKSRKDEGFDDLPF